MLCMCLSEVILCIPAGIVKGEVVTTQKGGLENPVKTQGGPGALPSKKGVLRDEIPEIVQFCVN